MEKMMAGTIVPEKKGSFELKEVAVPEINEDEVLVKVLKLGLDGTDREIGEGLYGQAPEGQGYLIPGHESLGVVEQVGKRVNGISAGELVVATVRRPDDCINCKSGESDMCVKGDYKERGIKGLDGYMAEYYKERPEYLVRIPNGLSNVAMMLEPLSIAEKAVMEVFAVQKRMIWEPKTAMVLGTGTVGLFAAMLLRLRGLEVVSVDRTSSNPVKDRIYSGFGITHVNSAETPIASIPEKLSKKIDVAVELTGNPAAVAEAFSLPGINGILCLLSVTGESYMYNMDIGRLNYDMVLGNKVVMGSVNSNIKHFLQGVEDMVAMEGKASGVLESMVTKRIKLADFKDYSVLGDRSQIKVVLDIGSA
ncbi:MAG: Alcohol dehydrogenase GroES domain protein [Candidatus Micrarchaeum acidiphilum ARMAN-2]|uniref:Alcohol dehydrogenase GroES domain protein n=1 Tax=Candidatus Micrarchaeum acidiphilum ARMAN-2 TaxID=425595 RepID=C7DH56_MICA2|nr:MAG: Alcohol dehydrogenase GroES domain protein [Candidatus Micrarchaeum acidiphilum ARMAN-2]